MSEVARNTKQTIVKKQEAETSLELRLAKIEARNERVEVDKAWEVSWQRRILILTLTYLLILLYFLIIEVEKPLLNAIVPTLGFFLSTLTLSVVKTIWLKRNS